jgi:hypothetical protein
MWAFYLTMYLASHIWLSGSVLLPCMLIVRWGAARWRGLHHLTRSKKRWLLIWGCYGLVEVLAIGAALLWSSHFEFIPFDSLGWAGMVVWSVLDALHIHIGLIVEFALGLALKAIGEAAIDCGLAAIAWWSYEVLTRNPAIHKRIERYGLCMLFSTCVLGVANNSYFWRSQCADCFAPHGVPFLFFHEGGFAGGEGFIWKGVIGNSFVVLALASVLSLVWSSVPPRRSN